MKAWVWILTMALLGATVAVFWTHPPLNSGEWAAWAQAIGTLAALLGVFWVAHAEARQRRHEALAMASVTAEVVACNLPYVIETMTKAHRMLGEKRSNEEILSFLIDLRRWLEGMPVPTEDQLLRLIPLGANFSKMLAEAIGSAMRVRSTMALVIDDVERPEHLGKGVDALQQVLWHAQKDLKARLDELERLSQSLKMLGG